MTQREKILAILVGVAVIAGFGQWGFSTYRSKIAAKASRYDSLQDQKVQLDEKVLQGAFADRQFGEYLVRSVSSDIEKARTEYKSWLLEVIKKHRFSGAEVSGDRVNPVGDLYRQLSFDLTGRARVPQIVELIHEIQAMDYLHRIREIDLKRVRNGDEFELELSIDVLSLNAAPVEAEKPETKAWRVESDLMVYREPILNRNLFEPPNQPPSYDGRGTLEAVIGKEGIFPLPFKDPEKHNLEFELVDAPESVSLDSRSGTLRVESDEVTEIDVTVRVSDDGYPKQSVEETLLVKFNDPPPEPVDPPKPLEFDDAKQTYLTGLVQGAKEWTAWIDVRTRGKTLKLRVGDEFEVGSVRGVVREINSQHVKIQVEERLVTLPSGGVLKKAVDTDEGN